MRPSNDRIATQCTIIASDSQAYPGCTMDWKSATTKDDGTISVPERWLHLHYYEALNILFRMENALRVFVYVVLKNKFKENWAQTTLQTVDEEKSTIAATAAKRIAQAKGYGYLGYEISSPLMYLNSGELTRIITSEPYWELFKPFFRVCPGSCSFLTELSQHEAD